ncbi:YbhB/YbcL family Raf kinase inhibitor-like protein [Sphingomonas sp. LY160]|uniref:YbhB/YbcL family Raf kinase inhibitor-like protein n=1 Tax=Sphingomonas sp. LY160 TaxID=3095342 RepID=UPI002ADEF149|nr:YbhB/YbcL family Raf kinase inhibitor-like protein [Sphingomonas sp. LY160]MEA1072480.1 YbhB/YbcL family Raf kinase inhibitor-like protein [Sphingomonas sp. LY160]
MLEHLPRWLGETLRSVRSGGERLAIVRHGEQDGLVELTLTSPAFADGGSIPANYSADGAGISPPLAWSGLPDGTRSLALLVEDADAPALQPLVHAIVWGLHPESTGLDEGAIDGHEGPDGEPGRNSYLRSGWLPPDPPTGHGPHHYAFQLFALDHAPVFEHPPGRSALIEAMTGHVLGAGMRTGTYERR